MRRGFISGFTGSAGTAVVTKEKAALWTDGLLRQALCSSLDVSPVGASSASRRPEFSNLWLLRHFSHFSRLAPGPDFPREIAGPGGLNLRFVERFSTLSNQENRGNGEETLKAEVSWIDLHFPIYVRPYAKLARLDKPIGTWLLAWPCMWSISMAAQPGHLPDLKTMTLFGCGALLLRGAGCTVNDLLDRDIDTKVDHTRLRPIASGLLTPFQGLCFLGSQLLLGLGILIQLNDYSKILGASSLLLVFSYPRMKRFTFWVSIARFVSNKWFGAIIFSGALFGRLLQ